jgi:hypothetical protein
MNAPLRSHANETVRRAMPDDVPRLARLFTAVFANDPVFAWLTRAGVRATRRWSVFFLHVLKSRTLPHGETWVAANGLAAASWIPPYSPLQTPSLIDDLRMFPTVVSLTGLPRLARGAAMASAMAEAHPEEPCFLSRLHWRRTAFAGRGPWNIAARTNTRTRGCGARRRLSGKFEPAEPQSL